MAVVKVLGVIACALSAVDGAMVSAKAASPPVIVRAPVVPKSPVVVAPPPKIVPKPVPPPKVPPPYTPKVPPKATPCHADCEAVHQHGWRGYIDGRKCTQCTCNNGKWDQCQEEQCLVPAPVYEKYPCGLCHGRPKCRTGPNGRDTCEEDGMVCIAEPSKCNPYTGMCDGCCVADACSRTRCPSGTSCRTTVMGGAECVPDCETECGTARQEGWRGYVDGKNHCNMCTCHNGKWTGCTRASCEPRDPPCLGEDDYCTDRTSDCPLGTECRDCEGNAPLAGVGDKKVPSTCTARFLVMSGKTNRCSTMRCLKDHVCRVDFRGTPRCYAGCETACGTKRPHGWSGKDDGHNYCNTCTCKDGTMACTKVFCIPAKKCPEQCTPQTPPKLCWPRLKALSAFTTLSRISRNEKMVVAADATQAISDKALPVSAVTWNRYCYNAATCTCGYYPMVACVADPCSTNTCADGYECKANYCGGCNYQCIKRRCPARVRKAYSLLSCKERALFVDAIQELKTQKPAEWSDFVRMHLQAGSYAHGTSAFLPWHRFYLVGFENALRSLGGRFECITLPYWDTERDANDPANASPLRANTFGRSTGVDGSGCVSEGVAAFPGWKVSDGVSCLRRSFGGFGFSGEAAMANLITGSANYQSFRPGLEGGPHGSPHIYVGGHMGGYSSPEDPLFWMHHCNVDRMWALWQDYNGYDTVAPNSLTAQHYFPSAGGSVNINDVQLNSVLPFAVDNIGTLMSYFQQPVTIRQTMFIDNMPYGNSYTYDIDNLANQIGAPAAGGWDWVVPGAAPKVNCFSVVPWITVVGTLFQNVALQETFARNLKQQVPRAANLNNVATQECAYLRRISPVTPAGTAKLREWARLMGTDMLTYDTCYIREV